MTPTEFWEGNVYLTDAYRKAYVMKLKQQNAAHYEQGLYVFHAVAIALSNIHLDGKKHKENGYLTKPFDLYLTKEESEELARKNAEQENQKLIVFLNNLQTSWENKEKRGTEYGTKN